MNKFRSQVAVALIAAQYKAGIQQRPRRREMIDVVLTRERSGYQRRTVDQDPVEQLKVDLADQKRHTFQEFEFICSYEPRKLVDCFVASA